jgi:hypothetical protein
VSQVGPIEENLANDLGVPEVLTDLDAQPVTSLKDCGLIGFAAERSKKRPRVAKLAGRLGTGP